MRKACDAHVLEYLRGETAAGFDDGRIGDPAYISAVFRSAPPVMRYLARAMVDGSPAAATVFDEMVALTERYLGARKGHSDPHTVAVVFTAMRLGVTVLHEHVSRGLGTDIFADVARRTSIATLDIVAPELMPEGLAHQVRASLDDHDTEGGGR